MCIISIIFSIVLSPKLGALGAGIAIFFGTFLGGIVIYECCIFQNF